MAQLSLDSLLFHQDVTLVHLACYHKIPQIQSEQKSVVTVQRVKVSADSVLGGLLFHLIDRTSLMHPWMLEGVRLLPTLFLYKDVLLIHTYFSYYSNIAKYS